MDSPQFTYHACEATNSAPSTPPPDTPKMNILFLCTAHNSLSQQLYLKLSQTHTVTIEYALSDTVMIEAASLVQPDIIICPFLTAAVPSEVYSKYPTLIVHPGPPGDAGPSAIDWVLMGDDGTVSDSAELLKSQAWSKAGRSHWGVTILQAVAEMDAGPVWAFEQFEIEIDAPGMTKATLYRGPVTQAAITATVAALDRITSVVNNNSDLSIPTAISEQLLLPEPETCGISVHHLPKPIFKTLSVTQQKPFPGGTTHRRPLLKAAERNFDTHQDSAKIISRKIRSADSQPGCLTKLFGNTNLYVYGGIIEAGRNEDCDSEPGQIIGCRDGAVCVATCDGLGIWITHIRRVKRKVDSLLWPKVPAVSGLLDLGYIDQSVLSRTESLRPIADWTKATWSTLQAIWIDFTSSPGKNDVAFVYFEFYNGAMSTPQCSRLIEALEFIASHRSLDAVVLMGGDSYFSNGIALNVIEASRDPSAESWRNINRIDDVVHILLDVFPRKNITTVAALRGNCAAGGVALAAACDVVIVSSQSVLNPAYRAIGLYGSEYHSLSYVGRCGPWGSKRILRDMLPLSASQAREIGLIDHVLPGSGDVLDTRIRDLVQRLIQTPYKPGIWKSYVDISAFGFTSARTLELSEMAKDFWSTRSQRYTSRRRDFVRKVKPSKTPLRFATHRRRDGMLDEEETDSFDDIATYQVAQ
ncbi:related to sensor protein hoxX [Fusarium torulosum]|uniref:Related to sensor protein hoxX n=1 Tax=Fusarium torulosum TaxID=33205 RepID=A0AAE8MAS3_9HYPO|nr:related to sensor protein hoxX [Fusarium torulosum]